MDASLEASAPDGAAIGVGAGLEAGPLGRAAVGASAGLEAGAPIGAPSTLPYSSRSAYTNRPLPEATATYCRPSIA